MKDIVNMSRRDFLKTGTLIGGGLVLGIDLSSCARPQKTAASFTPNAFLRIGSDDGVTVVVNKSEMGQGVYTALPMLLAEELEADWTRIRVEPAPVDHAYDHTEWGPLQGTGGSSSVRSEWDRFRKAGAVAREMLVSAAAAQWKVERAECRAEAGMVVHSSGKTARYGAWLREPRPCPCPRRSCSRTRKTSRSSASPPPGSTRRTNARAGPCSGSTPLLRIC